MRGQQCRRLAGAWQATMAVGCVGELQRRLATKKASKEKVAFLRHIGCALVYE